MADGKIDLSSMPPEVIQALLVSALSKGSPQNKLGGMDLTKVSPELLKAYAEAGLIDDKQAMQMYQLKQADALRETKHPEGITAGGMYINASPLSYISGGIDRVKGALDSQKYEKEYGDTLKQYGDTVHERLKLQQQQAFEEKAAEQAQAQDRQAAIADVQALPTGAATMQPTPGIIEQHIPTALRKKKKPYEPEVPNSPLDPSRIDWSEYMK